VIDFDAVDQIRDDLEGMIGMESVSRQVNRLVAEAVNRGQRERAGLPVKDKPLHMVFAGPSGTGKTTVAKDIAKLYHALGLTPKDTFHETDRSKMVGEYSNQVSMNTTAEFEKARGGVLFIDEAYTLHQGDSDKLGKESVDRLMKLMGESPDTVVIFAGYPEEMEAFKNINPGLRSRIPTTITFDKYSDDDLEKIAHSMLRKYDYVGAKGFKAALREAIEVSGADGNAREVEVLTDKITTAAGLRHAVDEQDGADPSPRALRRLTADDVEAGLADYLSTRWAMQREEADA
jgi:SpoVK/Ycf46/Vps4 family AAA+-type ATPase